MAVAKTVLQKIISFIPKSTGAAGRVTLGPKQLAQIAEKSGDDVAKAVTELTKGAKNPTLDIAYKAQENYAIAGMRLRDGKKVVGTGAVSVSNPNTPQAVTKYRAQINEGRTLQANGFIDGGQVADGKDVAMSLARRNGMVTADASVGQATRHHISFNEADAVDTAKLFGADDLLKGYAKATNNFQRGLDRGMLEYRQIVGTGTAPTIPTATTITPITPPAIKTLKPAKGKVDKFTAHTIGDDATKNISEEIIAKVEKGARKTTRKARVAFSEQDALKKFKELARTDRAGMEAYRTQLNKEGYQAFFHPLTGEPQIMKAKNMAEVRKKLALS